MSAALRGLKAQQVQSQGNALGSGLAALSGRVFKIQKKSRTVLSPIASYLAQNRAEIFLYFEHPTREGNKMFVAFLFMPRGKMLSGGRHRMMFYPPQPPDDERKPTMPSSSLSVRRARVFVSLFPYRILSFCPTAMGPPRGMPLFL